MWYKIVVKLHKMICVILCNHTKWQKVIDIDIKKSIMKSQCRENWTDKRNELKKMTNAEYREWLIEQIIVDSKYRFTQETLENKSIRSLEIIYDNLFNFMKGGN